MRLSAFIVAVLVAADVVLVAVGVVHPGTLVMAAFAVVGYVGLPKEL